MPTGLTHQIYDGSDISFRTFAIKCLGQTGAGYRATEGGSKNLPRYTAPVIKPDLSYHQEHIDVAEAELETLRLAASKDPELVRSKYDKYCADTLAREKESQKEDSEVKKRYTDMLAKVVSWDAPSELNGLKSMMKEQIEDSMRFDCNERYHEKSNLLTIDEWIKSTIESLEWDIKYHSERISEEKKYAKEANEFFKKAYEEIDKIDPPDEESD